jgi:hypothetical protein
MLDPDENECGSATLRNSARDLVMYICSEQMKYQLPEQVEQKYLPPDQQRLTEHERYFQVVALKYQYRFSIFSWVTCSVADPGCVSRILIFTHPGSKTSTKERGGKKLKVIPLFVAINFTKLKIILFLKC